MAEIQPLRAWQYNNFLKENLQDITASMSETVTQQKKAMFYQQPFHYFHISSPIDTPPYHNAKRRAENWKLDKVIEQDALEGIYIYCQYFHLKENPEKIYVRKGFIAHIRATDFDKKIVLPHELTIKRAVEHRVALLENTNMHTIPTHAFYTDEQQVLEKYIDESITAPIADVTDQNGTRHVLSVIHDRKIIDFFVQNLADKQVWIADGHHRYESSCQYAKLKKEQNPNHKGNELYNFHLMWFTNTASSSLGVFPTHRIIHSLKNFDEKDFFDTISEYFDIEETTHTHNKGLAPSENLGTFLLVFAEKSYLAKLKKDAMEKFNIDLPNEVKRLDLSVLHYFMLEKGLGLKEQMQFEYLDFTHQISQCYKQVAAKQAQFAVITRKVTLSEIESVIKNGYIMPAKTTYFFPKVLGGLVFSSAE
ncbi:MAG: DUF1015 domain-containing protein [Cytophagia bacterium]|nr:MAG: DUF1015 domain-containing protein [Cytophagia bacterium]TAG43403.1 MAG: DUF1015 domain-containing protein [Cytophagia bacterium]